MMHHLAPQTPITPRRTCWRQTPRLVAALAATTITVAACGSDDGDSGGGSDGGPVTITLANWAETEDATRPGFQETLERFESENPDIDVETEGIAFSDIGQQLIQRVQGGNPPDVAQIAGNDTFALAGTGALAPLDELISDDVISSINESSLAGGTADDQLIAFPWIDSPQGFWYNKKLMEQAGLDPASPPQTIDDLMTALAAITQEFPDITPLGLDTTNRAFGLGANWAWMKTFGAEPFNGTEASFDNPEMQDYLAWMRELSSNGYIEPGKKIGEFRPLAAQDEVAFIWDQDVFQGVVQSTNGMSDEEFYDTWGVTTLPAGPSSEAYSVNQGHQLVVFNKSENKEAAAKLIEYLATDQQSITDYTMETALATPPLADPQGEVATQLDNPVKQAFLDEIIPTFTVPPYGQTFSQGYGPVMAGVQQVVTSDAGVGEVSGEIQNQLESVLG